ncbi:hypothetical protein AVEN_250767-1, partial [Araneus ventricosus]
MAPHKTSARDIYTPLPPGRYATARRLLKSDTLYGSQIVSRAAKSEWMQIAFG